MVDAMMPMPQTIRNRTTSAPPPGSRRRRAGLTLWETSLATLIVGLAVVAISQLILSVTQENFYAQKTTTALTLANNVRELLIGLPFNDPAFGTHLGPNTGQATIGLFNDVEDFNGYATCPPIDANRQPITALPNWQQSVTVAHITPGANGYNTTDPASTDPGVVLDRVTITVSYSATPSDATSWKRICSVEFLKSKY
jgi:hypothetical protein